MNVGSTFSGVGGLDLGLERAGMQVKWQAEVDEWCRRVLAWHWPDARIYDDVRAVDGSAENIDLLTGGFPCQDLSVAGKRAGLAGERSGLFFEFARIADELRPDWLLVENVVGLLSSSEGRDFGIVLSTLAEIGYGLSWRVLNAQYFGVPQRRRRVFIVGCLGDSGERAVRALGAGGEGDLEAGRCSWQGATAGIGQGASGSGGVTMFHPTQTPITSSEASPSLGTTVPGMGVFTEPQAKCLTTSNQRIDAETETFVVANALDRMAGGPDDNSAQANHIVSFAENQRGELRESQVAMSMGTGGGKAGKGYAAVRAAQSVRRLTPTECERLMSWPDGWTAIDGEDTPDGRRYAACGNGVVSNVSEWIGRRIMAVENE